MPATNRPETPGPKQNRRHLRAWLPLMQPRQGTCAHGWGTGLLGEAGAGFRKPRGLTRGTSTGVFVDSVRHLHTLDPSGEGTPAQKQNACPPRSPGFSQLLDPPAGECCPQSSRGRILKNRFPPTCPLALRGGWPPSVPCGCLLAHTVRPFQHSQAPGQPPAARLPSFLQAPHPTPSEGFSLLPSAHFCESQRRGPGMDPDHTSGAHPLLRVRLGCSFPHSSGGNLLSLCHTERVVSQVPLQGDRDWKSQHGLCTTLGTRNDTLVLSHWSELVTFLLSFMFVHFSETQIEGAGEGQRARGTQNQKWAPGSELSARSPMRGSNPRTVRL